MLPVRVKIISSSPCNLSEASLLLQRFLSSDACSDSFARSSVVNVALALDESLSRRTGASLAVAGATSEQSGRKKRKEKPSTSSHEVELEGRHPRKLPLDETRLEEGLRAREVEAGSEAARFHDEHRLGRVEKDYEKQGRKRKHAALDNGAHFMTPSEEQVAAGAKSLEDGDKTRHLRKKRKREKKAREDSTPNNVRSSEEDMVGVASKRSVCVNEKEGAADADPNGGQWSTGGSEQHMVGSWSGQTTTEKKKKRRKDKLDDSVKKNLSDLL